jgi:hypothetical protein
MSSEANLSKDHRVLLMEVWPKGSKPPQGYLARHDWAEAQIAHGLIQKQCQQCKLWSFPQDPCECRYEENPPVRREDIV